MQHRFELPELQAFFRLVDGELPRPCTLILLGPTALALGYCPKQSAMEIEIWRTSDSVIFTAADRAGESVARPMRIHQVLAGEPRHTFEDRLQPVRLEGLRLLTVLVPEAHDLAILTAARGERMDGVTELHANHPLALDTLIERYHEMKREVSWPRARFRESFLRLITKLFGAEQSAAVAKRLKD